MPISIEPVVYSLGGKYLPNDLECIWQVLPTLWEVQINSPCMCEFLSTESYLGATYAAGQVLCYYLARIKYLEITIRNTFGINKSRGKSAN